MAILRLPFERRGTSFYRNKVDHNHPLTNGLVGAWFISEQNKSLDLAKNINDGTLTTVGTRGYSVSPLMGENALVHSTGHTDGDGINMPTGNLISNLGNATVVARVAVSAASSDPGGNAIYCERASTGQDIWKIDFYDFTEAAGNFFFTHRDTAGTLTQVRPGAVAAINDGRPHTVSVVKSGTNVDLWKDGVAISTGNTLNGTDTLTTSTIAPHIGKDPADDTGTWQGDISVVLVYDRTLSSGELSQLHENIFQILEPNVLHFPITAAGAAITDQDKWSMLSYQQPHSSTVPVPTGSLDQGDNQHFMAGYSGINWATPAAGGDPIAQRYYYRTHTNGR